MGNIKYGLLNKKGQSAGGFLAWFFVIIVLFAAALFFLIINKVWGEVSPPLNEALNKSVPAGDQEKINKVISDTSGGISSFDKLMPFLLIGLMAFVMIIAGTIIDSPVMLFVGVIIMAVVIIIGVVYANVYNEISTSAQFTSTNDQLTIQNKFMQYLPIIGFLMAIGIGIAIMVRRSQVSGGRY